MWILRTSLQKFINLISFLIVARAIFSWFSRDFYNPIYRFLYQVTEPILTPFRNLQYRLGIGGMIDFSPILAILALDIVGRFIISLL